MKEIAKLLEINKTIYSLFGMSIYFIFLNTAAVGENIFTPEFAIKLKSLIISDKTFYCSIVLYACAYIPYYLTHRTFITNSPRLKILTETVFEIAKGVIYSTYYICSGILLLTATIMLFFEYYGVSILFVIYSFVFMTFAVKINSFKLKDKTIINQLEIIVM